VITPKLLVRRAAAKWYWLILTASVLLFTYFIHLFHYYSDEAIGFNPMSYIRRIFDNMFSVLAVVFTSTVMALWVYYTRLVLRQREEQEQHLKAELSFLRSQINPHFLFNSLNSIYSLALSKSENTPEAVVKLSGLMRFVLYESAGQFIPLQSELGYITDYVELQKLRTAENVNIRCDITGSPANLAIAPMLLITFIENAFKHGPGYTRRGFILIQISVNRKTLNLHVENTAYQGKPAENPGIGLGNVIRRLDILYNGNYSLNHKTENDIFTVDLRLELNEIKNPDS
jgi:LytS/YehU family sensor histidine kinase